MQCMKCGNPISRNHPKPVCHVCDKNEVVVGVQWFILLFLFLILLGIVFGRMMLGM